MEFCGSLRGLDVIQILKASGVNKLTCFKESLKIAKT